ATAWAMPGFGSRVRAAATQVPSATAQQIRCSTTRRDSTKDMTPCYFPRLGRACSPRDRIAAGQRRPPTPPAPTPHRPPPPAPAGPPAGLDWIPGELAELDAERPPRPPRGRLVAGLLSAALVIALLGWALPWATGASWGEITGTLTALPAWSVPAMVLLGVGALLLEAVTVRAALPGARWGGVLLAHPAAGATALAVPGGTVIGLGLMGWILRRSGLALPVVLT